MIADILLAMCVCGYIAWVEWRLLKMARVILAIIISLDRREGTDVDSNEYKVGIKWLLDMLDLVSKK